MVKQRGQIEKAIEDYERIDEQKKALGEKQKDITAKLKDAGRSIYAFKLLAKLRKLETKEMEYVLVELQQMIDEAGMQLSFDLPRAPAPKPTHQEAAAIQ